MINLDSGVGSDVLLQFKHPVYLIGAQGSRLVPINLPKNNNEPGPPLIVDHMEGRLRKEGESYLLTYLNPVDMLTQLDFVVDPENVGGMWAVRKIQLITGTVPPG